MKKSIFAFISVILILGIIAGSLAYFTDGFKDFDKFGIVDKVKDAVNVDASGVFDFEGNAIDIDAPVKLQSMSLTKSAFASAQSGEHHFVEVELYAEVYPVIAADKSCSWKVEWSDSSTEQDINLFMTIDVDSENSQNALLTVGRPFPFDDAVLTVKTNDGDFEDTAIIKYEGAPDTLSVASDAEFEESLYNGNPYYKLHSGIEEQFFITQDNNFGCVGQNYNEFDIEFDFNVSSFVYARVSDYGDNQKKVHQLYAMNPYYICDFCLDHDFRYNNGQAVLGLEYNSFFEFDPSSDLYSSGLVDDLFQNKCDETYTFLDYGDDYEYILITPEMLEGDYLYYDRVYNGVTFPISYVGALPDGAKGCLDFVDEYELFIFFCSIIQVESGLTTEIHYEFVPDAESVVLSENEILI